MYEDSHLEETYEETFHYEETFDNRDYEEEAYWDTFCDACGESPCTGLCLDDEDAYEPEPREREEPEVDDGPYHFIMPGTENW